MKRGSTSRRQAQGVETIRPLGTVSPLWGRELRRREAKGRWMSATREKRLKTQAFL